MRCAGSTGRATWRCAGRSRPTAGEICTVDRTFSCRSVSQCVNALIVYPYERPQGLVVNEDDAVEIPEMFAGYVEEENPEIDRIMEQALQEVALPSGFNGYQSGDENYLFQQMCAIWYVLQQTGVSYSNATQIPGQAEDVRVQNVRFLVRLWPARRRTAWREPACWLRSTNGSICFRT